MQTGDATEAAQILRERLNAAGITAEVTAGDGTLTITAPDTARADVTALTAPGRLAIYDWERSVLGPDGRPAPTDPAVTGGPGAGQAAALTEAEARSRADKRPGARALQADRGWFALGGDAALTNADVASARADEDPAGGGPAVALDLTPAGQQAFTTLTRELAQRGADQAVIGRPAPDLPAPGARARRPDRLHAVHQLAGGPGRDRWRGRRVHVGPADARAGAADGRAPERRAAPRHPPARPRLSRRTRPLTICLRTPEAPRRSTATRRQRTRETGHRTG